VRIFGDNGSRKIAGLTRISSRLDRTACCRRWLDLMPSIPSSSFQVSLSSFDNFKCTFWARWEKKRPDIHTHTRQNLYILALRAVNSFPSCCSVKRQRTEGKYQRTEATLRKSVGIHSSGCNIYACHVQKTWQGSSSICKGRQSDRRTDRQKDTALILFARFGKR